MFGKFVDMDIVFNSLLVYHILLREVQSNRIDVMLTGKIVKFSKDEFWLVTGLWRSPTKLVRSFDMTESLWTKYFNNLMATEVRLTKFEECYKELVFENDLNVMNVSHY